MNPRQHKQVRYSIPYWLMTIFIAWIFQALIFAPLITHLTEVPYSKFLTQLRAGEVEQVTLAKDRIIYTVHDEKSEAPDHAYNVVRVDDPDLIQRLTDAGVTFSAEAPTNSLLTTILGWVLPMVPLAAVWYWMMKRIGSPGAGVMAIGKSRAHEIQGEMTGVKFSDVGGAEEVEVELREIIEFLKNPEKFAKLGAKLPKGVLLVGPPGTGKTLLAKATAGEAGVPFFSISGSDFVEMFVGVGAARVRDLFEEAKQKAPCIVFIDEIDAIGQARSTALTVGGHSEQEQTLNQLLTEMDGFESNQGVVIMAATNRPEVLDKALLRPGRFDRQIQVVLPTEAGRRQILGIHTRNVPLADDVDLDRIAQITAGFSGADLANIVNEAALLAVRHKHDQVTAADFDAAIERVVAGLQRKMTLPPELKKRVAYHEGGHALVAQLQPHTDPVHKVSIIPTAKGALGYTLQMPDEDTYLLTKEELLERLAVMLGGRAAERVIFEDTSTGAANDLERATELARRMVTEYGMTEALGPVRYLTATGMGYLGQTGQTRPDLSPETAQLIDRETRRIVESAEGRAIELLNAHLPALHEVARILQEQEVISGETIRRLAEQASTLDESQP